MTNTVEAQVVVLSGVSFASLHSKYTVKELVYLAFDSGSTLSHKELANTVLTVLVTAKTSDKSVASMKVDWKVSRSADGVACEHSTPRGQVKELVYAMFGRGGMTAQAIADEVRRLVPGASTTDKSVASMKVDWKKAGNTVAAKVTVEMTADMLGL